MKKTLLLLTAAFCLVQPIFAQSWNFTGPQFIQVSGTNTTSNMGLMVQGSTGIPGIIAVEGNGNSAFYGMAATATNYMVIGLVPPTGAGYSAITIDGLNHVGINTWNTTNYLFTCAGTAAFDQVTVTNIAGSNNPKATPWADYVFAKNYHLQPLDSLSAYIKANSHLPGIPTSEEVQKNGLNLGASQAQLLEKIEQLTLYTIDLQEQMKKMQQKIDELSKTRQ
jgi:hypothetical protein